MYLSLEGMLCFLWLFFGLFFGFVPLLYTVYVLFMIMLLGCTLI